MLTQEPLKISETVQHKDVLGNEAVSNLRGRSVRGAVAVLASQGLKVGIQVVSITVLSRLLAPGDFGIQSMIVAMTGFLGLFRDGGLSAATVQQDVITHEQTSTLFWINTTAGLFLALLVAAISPLLVIFYKEPRLLWATMISASSFVLNGLSVQHQALLVRRLRFGTMAAAEVAALGGGVLVGITMASLGFGYWSLIGMAVSGPAISVIVLWIVVPWRPGLPSRRCGVRSMLNFGGTVTANCVVLYLGSNGEKFLLGRFFGSIALGLYTRAYQLINVPMQQLNSAVFNVVFPTLSRIRNDTERACRFFLKYYSLIVSLCIPITLASALFPSEIIPIVLGAKWTASIPILKLLSPTIVAYALMDPFGPFLMATGRALRGLQTSFLVAPTVLVGIGLGLRHGPTGVAMGYSAAMVLLVIPMIAWSKKGTGLKTADIWRSIKAPAISGVVAYVVGILFGPLGGDALSQVPHLILGLFLVFGTYLLMLLFAMGQWQFYRDLAAHLLQRQ